jgi:shikimate dehydrogenase
VEHSLSPVIHNAAFDALDLDWRYFAVTVPPGRAADAVAAMRSLRLGGMSVTMPHKDAVAAAVDEVAPDAASLGAVNCVSWRGTVLVGDNTDGAGFLDALRRDEGIDPAGRRALVLGAGGAARAVVQALAGAGAAEVVVANRTAERGAAAAALAGPVGRTGGPAEAERCDLIVNATSVGLGGDGGTPIDPARLGPGQLVVDLVYEPATTPLLAAARARGAVAVNGLGMLIHQAAHAFRRWTGEDPPLAVMSAAATAELARRTS